MIILFVLQSVGVLTGSSVLWSYLKSGLDVRCALDGTATVRQW